jgi:hypothetical protein
LLVLLHPFIVRRVYRGEGDDARVRAGVRRGSPLRRTVRRVTVEVRVPRAIKTTTKLALAVALTGLSLGAGCQEARSPARVEVPQRPGEGQRFDRDEMKPLPRDDGRADALQPAPFEDVPLVMQSPPEQRAYVRAYEEVGRPRIVVAVNRGTAPEADAARQGKGGEGDAGGIGVRTIDAEAVENILTDWFAADGQVDIISPLAQGKPLTDKQKNDLREGQGGAVARDVGGDVLVQVSSRITEQAGRELQLRMVAEAVNVGDGRSIGRAVVDVPAPLDKPKINKYTRFMARKLMDGMILTWQRMAKEGGGAAANPPGGTTGRTITRPRAETEAPPAPAAKEPAPLPAKPAPLAPTEPPPAPSKPAPPLPPGAPAEDVSVAPGSDKR